MLSVNQKYILLLAALIMGAKVSNAQQVNNPEDNIPQSVSNPVPITGPYPGLVNLNGYEKKNSVRTWIPDQPTTTVTNTVKHRQKTDYFDGLGRPFQTVNKKGHSDGSDIVQQHIYDSAGRESRIYLPHIIQAASSSGDMDYLPKLRMEQFYPYAQGEQPYMETVFDNSPLNRVVKQMNPGKSWVGSGRGISTVYRGNKTDEHIRRWTISSNPNATPTSPGDYVENELSVVEVRDEDDKISYVFTDKLGRKVLTRSFRVDLHKPFNYEEYASTYYVYNDLNQLRYVLSPQATAILADQQWTNTASVSELCFRYVYDEKGRMVEKQIPGKEAEYMIYDLRDRLVLTQDGKLRAQQKWYFTFYDGLNRPTTTGFLNLSFTRQQAQAAVSATPTFTYPTNNWLYYINGYNIEHSQAYPTSISNGTILAYSYYDRYGQFSNSNLNFDQTKVPVAPGSDPTIMIGNYSQAVLGKVTGTKVKVLDPEDPNGSLWINTAMYYNKEGQLLQSRQNNLRDGIETFSNLYFFQGMPYENTIYHNNPESVRLPGATAALTEIKLDKKYKRNFGMGGNDLVWNIQQSINDGTPYNLAYYDYNHMGAVTVKQFTVANVLQEYNIRGWLKHIQARNPADQDENYFNETLHYNDGFRSKLYNGNISGITWSYYNTDDNTQKHTYGYSYDMMNRLSHAEYRNNFTNLAQWSNMEKDYTASDMLYDHNGNLLTMNQRGNESGVPVNMDQLTYNYENNSNKLVKVSDAVLANATPSNPDFKDSADLGVEYAYDENGNMISDANKGISSITYNYLNKPEVITVDGKGTITNVYDAGGNRLQKKVFNSQAGTTEVWDYMGNFIYKDNVLQYILNEEGRSRPRVVDSGSQAGQTRFVYDYFIKDHLGNVRSTIGAEPIDQMYLARHEIATANAEQLIFDNIAAVRSDKPGSVNLDDTKAARLVANDPKKRIGTAIMLKVMPGDKFTFGTDAYYDSDETPTTENPAAEDIISSLLAALTGGTVGGVPVSEMGQNSEIINSALGNASLPAALTDLQSIAYANHSGPKAGLNYLFFDKNMKLLPQISGILPIISGPGSFNTTQTQVGPVQSTGYVIVYVNNQSIGTDAWFDNVLVSHYTGTVLDEEHYYPYGLTIAEANNPMVTANPYKYNGKELEKSFGLETYEYGARQYDPQLGRWKGVDPLADKYLGISPFAYVGNNPVKFIDPDGRFRLDANTIKNYPNFSNFVNNYYGNYVLGSQRMQDALSEYSVGGLTPSVIREATSPNNGPSMVAYDFAQPFQTWGQFVGDKNEIRISRVLIQQFEKIMDNPDASIVGKTAITMALSETISHEFTHYGDNLDGMDAIQDSEGKIVNGGSENDFMKPFEEGSAAAKKIFGFTTQAAANEYDFKKSNMDGGLQMYYLRNEGRYYNADSHTLNTGPADKKEIDKTVIPPLVK